MSSFDFKKEFKYLYLPKTTPEIITIPKMSFLAVRGKGNPNDKNGEYSVAVELLYGIAYTLKMSPKNGYHIEGYFEYVVPPLEGFWWMDDIKGVDYNHKELFKWISVIRLPDFITKTDFDWAINKATKDKKKDFSKVEFFTYDEGLTVQIMHIGPYDEEPKTVALMNKYIEEQGYIPDFENERMHHEIYLGDPRKTNPQNLKTIIRHPIKKA